MGGGRREVLVQLDGMLCQLGTLRLEVKKLLSDIEISRSMGEPCEKEKKKKLGRKTGVFDVMEPEAKSNLSK